MRRVRLRQRDDVSHRETRSRRLTSPKGSDASSSIGVAIREKRDASADVTRAIPSACLPAKEGDRWQQTAQLSSHASESERRYLLSRGAFKDTRCRLALAHLHNARISGATRTVIPSFAEFRTFHEDKIRSSEKSTQGPEEPFPCRLRNRVAATGSEQRLTARPFGRSFSLFLFLSAKLCPLETPRRNPSIRDFSLSRIVDYSFDARFTRIRHFRNRRMRGRLIGRTNRSFATPTKGLRRINRVTFHPLSRNVTMHSRAGTRC